MTSWKIQTTPWFLHGIFFLDETETAHCSTVKIFSSSSNWNTWLFFRVPPKVSGKRKKHQQKTEKLIESKDNARSTLKLTWWWLNHPNWKICSSKWVHLPQVSGWKYKIFELPPPSFHLSCCISWIFSTRHNANGQSSKTYSPKCWKRVIFQVKFCEKNHQTNLHNPSIDPRNLQQDPLNGTEQTPKKPEYLIALAAQLTVRGPLGKVPF